MYNPGFILGNLERTKFQKDPRFLTLKDLRVSKIQLNFFIQKPSVLSNYKMFLNQKSGTYSSQHREYGYT